MTGEELGHLICSVLIFVVGYQIQHVALSLDVRKMSNTQMPSIAHIYKLTKVKLFNSPLHSEKIQHR